MGIINFFRKEKKKEEVKSTDEVVLKTENKKETKKYDLDSKVDEYIDWYFENMTKGRYTRIGEFHHPRDMKNFIEKMAVWYELRYPEDEIAKQMKFGATVVIDVIKNIVSDSSHVKETVKMLTEEEKAGANQLIHALSWDELFDEKTFFRTLSWEEQFLMRKPEYPENIKSDLSNLSEERKEFFLLKGDKILNIVSGASDFYWPDMVPNLDCPFYGMSLEQYLEYLKKGRICISKDNSLEKAVSTYNTEFKSRESMLDCVMYRIIERGGNRIGPRRALLFAKEFDRNVDIPMIYGHDFSDPYLRNFIEDYMNAGGHKDLVCINSYFARESNNEKIETMTVEEMLVTYCNRYTDKEQKLQQELVDTLAKIKSKKEAVIVKEMTEKFNNWKVEKPEEYIACANIGKLPQTEEPKVLKKEKK